MFLLQNFTNMKSHWLPRPTPTVSTPDGLAVWTQHSWACSLAPTRVPTRKR